MSICHNTQAHTHMRTHTTTYIHIYQSSIIHQWKAAGYKDNHGCVRTARNFALFAKSSESGRSASANCEISREISRKSVESWERVSGVFRCCFRRWRPPAGSWQNVFDIVKLLIMILCYAFISFL